MGRMRFASIIFILSVYSKSAFGLSCEDVKQIIIFDLKSHFSTHEFTKDLEARSLQNFIKSLDLGKIYFMDEDIKSFEKEYKGGKLSASLLKGECTPLQNIYSIFLRRFEERMKEVDSFIDMKHNYAIDEYLIIDNKSIPYAQTTTESSNRLRKRIKFQYKNLVDTLKDPKQAREKLRKRYQLMAKHQRETKVEEIYGLFLENFSTSLDPHSSYLSPTQFEDFNMNTQLSLEGIGALLKSEDGFTKVSSLVPGGAAQKSGLLKVDDQIVAVTQESKTNTKTPPVDVIDMDLRDVVKLIRGPGGSKVKLTVRRDGKSFEVPLVREKIQLQDYAAKSKVYKTKVSDKKLTQNYKLGVLDLPSFYLDFESRQSKSKDFRSSSRDVLKELEKLNTEKIDGLILDLRGNGGGSLDEAINIAGLFNGPGPVVQIKGAEGSPIVNGYSGSQAYKGPLIVLIDRFSASSSEIVTAAIRDFDRGLIVGDSHTFGKGTVQQLINLKPETGAVTITISKFYRPAGSSTQLKGVDSDITLPTIFDHYEIGEKYYENALHWEQVPEAKQTNFGMVLPYVDQLNLACAKRIASDKGFKEIEKSIKTYVANEKERKQVSLKEKSKAEKAKEEKENLEREKKESEAEKDGVGNNEKKLEEDVYLQESLRIMTNYIRIQKNQSLAPVTLDLPPAKAKESPPKKPK